MGTSALVGAAMAAMAATSAMADPLDLYWTRTANGPGYDYRFELVLHNTDRTWVAGQNFNWIVFSNHSTLTSSNFVGDSSYFPIGPFTNYTTSGGGFDGPTLLDFANNFQGWVPTGRGDSLVWGGYSTQLATTLNWGFIQGTGVGRGVNQTAIYGATPVFLPDIDGGQTYTTTQLASSLVNPAFYGGTLTVSSSGTIANGFTVNGSGTINGAGQSSTFSGVIANGTTPGGLTLTGGGTVAFSGTNTFTGGIVVNGAVLQLNNTAGAGTGTIRMVDPQINFAATGIYANNISLEVANGQQAADPTVLNNTSGGNITLSGRIYETAGVGGANQYVTFSGAGVTTLTNAANSWGGVTTVSGGTTLSGTTASISGGSIVNNGTVIYTNTSAGTATRNISGSGGIQVTGTGPVTLNGNISTSGQFQVNGSGASLTLGGARTGSNNTGVVVTGTDAVLTVANTGSVQAGQFNGVRVSGNNVTVNNLGLIQNAGTGGDSGVGAGVYVTGAGGTTTVNNGSLSDTGAGSVIQGRNAGVRHEAGSTDTLVVNNYGHIIGDIYNGIENTAGALTVNNFNGGYIYTLLGNGISSNSLSAVSVTNAGVIGRNPAGNQTVGGNGISANGVVTLTNQTGGLIIGTESGARLAGSGSVINAGTITGTNQQGVILAAGGTLNNQATGVIRGANDAVQLLGTGSVTNAGQIHGGPGAFQRGVLVNAANSSVTNLAGGVIDGGRGVQLGGGATNYLVSNAGTIQSFGNYGIIAFNTGVINNLAGGLITSNIGAIYSNGFPVTVNNAGTITGGQYNAITTTAGGTINNLAGGVINAIPAGGWGIYAGGTTTVTNVGTINADSGITSAGTLTLNNTGLINGTVTGLLSYNNGVFNVTNSGTISASNTTAGRGMNLAGVNTVTNQATGVISGWRGIELAANATGSTITNAGSISGAQQGVLSFAGGVSVGNTGAITASAGHGVFMDAGGSLTNSGTITGLNHAFIGRVNASTVTNQAGGVMTGSIFNAVYTGGAGSVITNAGLMNGGNAGVYSDGANTSLTNTGTIRVTGTTAPTVISGVYMAGAGSSVTNAGTIESTLTDGRGVFLAGGTGSITNQSGGVISGNGAGAAVVLTGTDYTVDLQSGSTVNGLIDASLSGGHNVLTIAGAANGGYVGGTGADDVTLSAGMTLTGVLNGMDGVDSLTLGGAANGALNTGVLGGFESRAMNGTGTWTLSGADGDTSTWALNSGVLEVTGSQSINNAADVIINAGGTLAVINSEAIGALSGSGSVVVSDLQALLVGVDDSSSTFDGVISGHGGLQHLGTGVLTLTGTNTYTGASVVSAGTLQLGASGVIADGSDLSVSSGATLDMQGFDETVDLAFISGTLNGTGTLTGSEYQLSGATVNANLGAGNLFNTGGVSTLNGTAGSTNVTVQAGTLVLGSSDRLNDAAVLTIASGATFDLDGHNETVGSAFINGTLDGFGVAPPPPMPSLSDKFGDGREILPGIGNGTLTASQYQLNSATVNGNLGAGTLFNVSGLSTLNGTAGAGIVTIMAGTLQLGASNRLSDSANLTVLSGATLDLQAFSDAVGLAFLNGTLNGTGTLAASQYQLTGATVNANLGSGNLFNTGGVSVLNGTTNAGLVSVQTGTLRLGASDRINNAADLSVSAGATFDLNGNMETVRGLFGSGNVTVGAGRLTFGGVDSGFNGVLSGAGSVVHTGGIFTLINSHTINLLSNTGGELRFLGSTTGNVSVSGGSMTGAGTIGGALTVSGGATLSPGLAGTNNGIGGFNVGSLVMNGGRLSLDVLGQSGGSLSDLLQVTGNANLTGGVLAPNFHGPVTDFNFSTRYLFLTAGSRTGTFANGSAFTADPGGLAGLYWRVRYDLVANGAVMELRRLTNFTGSDGTANQNQVAGGLSEGQLEASDDWANVLSAFAGLDRDEQLEAFDSAGGEAIADISTSLFNANDSFMSAVRGATSQQANGETSMAFASTLGFVGGREGKSAMVANVLGAFDPGAEAAVANGGWISAYAGDATLEGKPGQADVQTRLNGFAGGYATTQGDVTVGVAGGVTRVEGDVDQRASTYESDLTHGAAFMRFDDGIWSVGVTGSLYGGQIDSRRTITVGALTGVARGSTDGEGQSISAAVSRRFKLDSDTLLAFGAETTASRTNLDGFTETGAGGLSLDVTAQSREWLTTVLSGRLNRTYRLNGRDVGIYGGLGVMLTSGDRQALADMRFSGAAAGFGDFTSKGAETAPVAGVADFGFEAEVSDSASVSLGYRGVFSERLDDHQVGARIQIRW